MKLINTLLTFAICFTLIFGDYIVFKSKYSNNHMCRAFTDNSVHAAVGLLSSLLFFNHGINVTSQVYISNVFLCTAVSSLIDIDHFILAKSFHFADLASLNRRGIFHCSTFWIIITTLLLLYGRITHKINIYISAFMVIIAFTSHHIRDANRRGLWLFPFGHTPPINKYIYIPSTCLLPMTLAYIYNTCKPYTYSVSREIV
ncbi:Transmembrane protein C5orf28 [Danaus plexippus plexippus]|uniref:Transmembrane protein 267 n=1 Tax=Danaus plexippus plexippus TaxID=278856 RepID=A0A212F1B5_DANPL|nr:Transmembrane protein C5orf28 [Danaus plexippus plexippus]